MSDRPTKDLHEPPPGGCISADALRGLADAVERLERYHRSMSGSRSDRPCLRRVEALGDSVIAHVASGPDVGGAWITLVLGPGGWNVRE